MEIDGYGGGENGASRKDDSRSALARFPLFHPAIRRRVKLAKSRSGIESLVVALDTVIDL